MHGLGDGAGQGRSAENSVQENGAFAHLGSREEQDGLTTGPRFRKKATRPSFHSGRRDNEMRGNNTSKMLRRKQSSLDTERPAHVLPAQAHDKASGALPVGVP